MSGNHIIRKCCPLCTSQQQTHITTVSLQHPDMVCALKQKYPTIPEEKLDFDYTLEECNECGLLFQKNIFTDSNLTSLYEDWIPRVEKVIQPKHVNFYQNELWQLAAAQKKALEDLNILEFGSGWGQWLTIARDMGCTVCGSELSESRDSATTSKNITMISNVDEFPDGSADLVYSNQVFEHLAEPREIFFQLSKKLKPGGFMLIKVPSGESIRDRILENKPQPWNVKSVYPLEHINCYQKCSFDALLESAQLTRIKIRPTYNKANLRQTLIDLSKYVTRRDQLGRFLFKKEC